MTIIRYISVSLLFVLIAIATIGGGCGGGGGANGNGDGDGELACESPPLNTDFSDIGVFFIDSDNSVLIGITSDGEEVVIVLSDIPFSGILIGVGGIPLSETVCDIILGLIDIDGDFEFEDILLPASGECRLEDLFSVFVLEDLVIFDVPLGVDLRGECEEIVSFNEVNVNNLNILKKTMTNKLQKMSDMEITKEDKSEKEENEIIKDFYEDINLNQKE